MKPRREVFRIIVPLASLIVALGSPPATAADAPGKRSAVVSACKADTKQLCADATTGGTRKAAVRCLVQNREKLSADCLGALRHAHRVAAFRHACGADWKAKCAGVKPGGRRVLECLAQKQQDPSPECQARVATPRTKESSKKGQVDAAAIANEAMGEEQDAVEPIDRELEALPAEPAGEPAKTSDTSAPPSAAQ
jgi:hypothetical protein